MSDVIVVKVGTDAVRVVTASSQGLAGPARQNALVMGVAGTIPEAPASDLAEFSVVAPFALTLTTLKATVKTAPSVDTTIQIRRSTDGGATFADALGTVVIAASEVLGVADPANLDIDEGDTLSFSITSGGGSGTNLAVFVIGTAR